MLGEASGEVFFSVRDEIAHLLVAGKFWALVKGARGIDFPDLPLSPIVFSFCFVAISDAPLASGD